MAGFTIEITTTGASESVTLPLVSGYTYNCTVDWNDGAPVSVTAWDDPDATHVYASAGTRNVIITGACPAFSVNNVSPIKTQITDVVTWGSAVDFDGFQYFENGLKGCVALSTLGDGPIITDGLASLKQAFYQTGSASIPSDLLDNCTDVVYLDEAFRYKSLSGWSIPAAFFDGLPSVESVIYAFANASLSGSITSGIFDSCISLDDVAGFFYSNSLTGPIPSGFFDNCPSITKASNVFLSNNLSGDIPDGLFRPHTSLAYANGAFRLNSSLVATSYIFYNAGEESTRFLDKYVTFQDAFNNCGTSESTGVVPNLWDCDFGTGGKNVTGWVTGHSASTLLNWKNIPVAFGGDAVSAPTITSAPSTAYDGQNITLATTDSLPYQYFGFVELCNNADYGLATVKVDQPAFSWSDSSLVVTTTIGALSEGTVYAFVTTDRGDRNATGYSLTLDVFSAAASPESPSSEGSASIEQNNDTTTASQSESSLLASLIEQNNDIAAAFHSASSLFASLLTQSNVVISAGPESPASELDGGIAGYLTTQLIPISRYRDTFEIVRDRIAEILAYETSSQQLQASNAGIDPSPYTYDVFVERGRPFERYIDGGSVVPIVNVWFNRDSYDEGRSNSTTRQLFNGDFYIDCYASSKSKASDSGHFSGDKLAIFNVHRVARIVRQVIMHPKYSRLGCENVWDRYVTNREVFNVDTGSNFNVAGARLTLNVSYNEVQRFVEPEIMESVYITLYHEPDGLIRAEIQTEE